MGGPGDVFTSRVVRIFYISLGLAYTLGESDWPTRALVKLRVYSSIMCSI